jgi:pimeloyl-ACP methyl ester carboxylesterase
MPAVFVHGVPDTHRVWNAVRSHLSREDVITLSLPGFGSPLPEGFVPEKDAYAEWLIGRIGTIGQPVDLVAHDWGALLGIRALSLRPELFRTWALGAAPLDREYRWHEAAVRWQTPQVGERVMEALTAERMGAFLVAARVPAAAASETAAHVDETMKRCILALYRSAIRVAEDWDAEVENVPAGGLVLWGECDPYAAPEFGGRFADRVGAGLRVLPDCGHWWQLERPAEIASELTALWQNR